MKSIDYYNLSDREKDEFFYFLKDASEEATQPAHNNMWDEDWITKNNTLPYILEKTSRFKDNGFYHVLFDDNKAIACSGAYQSEFSNEVAILGVRTWIHKDYRHKLLTRDYLLPPEKAWAISNNFKAIMLTFNEYNKNLRQLWVRQRLGENRPARKEHHFGYKNANIIEFPITVQYTKQYAIYEQLDNDWSFDWDTLR